MVDLRERSPHDSALRSVRGRPAPLVAVVVLNALMASLIGAVSLKCSGWDIAGNNGFLLAVRHVGYVGAPWVALLTVLRRGYFTSAIALVATGAFYVWLETGWMFEQPASSNPTLVAAIPFISTLALMSFRTPSPSPEGS